MTEYPMQPCTQDLWDLGEALTVGGFLASLFCTFASEDTKLRKSFGTACAFLGAVGMVAKAVTPPKCQKCCVRSVIDGAYWVCPNCHEITEKVRLLPPIS